MHKYTEADEIDNLEFKNKAYWKTILSMERHIHKLEKQLRELGGRGK